VTVDVARDFDRREVFIFAVKEQDENGEEAAVRIQLSGELNVQGFAQGQFRGNNKWLTAFRVIGKHSPAEVVSRDPSQPYDPPYSKDHAEINRYLGSDTLEVTFVETIEDDGGARPKSTWTTSPILAKAGDFSLMTPGILPQLTAPEFAHLISPFFFADRNHTFYVEPTLTEKTYTEWEDWVIPIPKIDPDDVPITADVPVWVNPGGPVEIDPLARFGLQEKSDWLAMPGSILQFDEALIGAAGGVNVQGLGNQIQGTIIGG
jgi:hypothetical protein